MSGDYRIPRQRISLVRDGSLRSSWKYFSNSRQVFEFAREQLYADVDREQFHVFLLDNKNRLIGINFVSQGSLSSAIVAPDCVFKAAIIANSPAIICTHPHPSGDPLQAAKIATAPSDLSKQEQFWASAFSTTSSAAIRTTTASPMQDSSPTSPSKFALPIGETHGLKGFVCLPLQDFRPDMPRNTQHASVI